MAAFCLEMIIPAGYYNIINAWVENPEEFKSEAQISENVHGGSVYMHIHRMVSQNLLEEEAFHTGRYRPTDQGWLAHHDHQAYYGLIESE